MYKQEKSLSQHPLRTQYRDTTIIHLSRTEGYRTLGRMLYLVRTRNSIRQQAVVDAAAQYLHARNIATVDRRMYSRIELDERPLKFNEIEAFFRAFLDEGATFSDVDTALFIQLARQRNEQKKKQREIISDQQWEDLGKVLAGIAHNAPLTLRIVDDTPEDDTPEIEDQVQQPQLDRRQQAITELLRTDCSHLLEREEWANRMLALLDTTPRKKLVAVQGSVGTGKTLAVALLVQRLCLQTKSYPIPYSFSFGEGKTPEDQLHIFLSTIITDLTLTHDDPKQRPLDEQIKAVIAAINERETEGQSIVFLLDNAQEIFSSLQWSPSWEAFLQTFIREQHHATIFLMTRTWPGWLGSQSSYVVETELPDLTLEAGITMWQRCGFDDVPKEKLYRATQKYGTNPQFIELSASYLKRPKFTFAWNANATLSRSPQRNSNTLSIEELLTQETIFHSGASLQQLQVAISSRLTNQMNAMLKCLALSPIGIPFPILGQAFEHAELTFDDLVRASFIDTNMANFGRAAAVPLVREAILHNIEKSDQKLAIDNQVMQLYRQWLFELQEFRDDAEKSALIAEIIVKYIRQRHILQAAELFISFGWLCTLYGQVPRIQRVFKEETNRAAINDNSYKVGTLLLSYHLSAILGEKVNPFARDADFKIIHTLVLEKGISLQPHTEVYIMYTLILRMKHEKRYQDAYDFIEETIQRVSQTQQIEAEVMASLLHNKANLLGLWSTYEGEQKNETHSNRLRDECIEVLNKVVDTWRHCLTGSLPIQEHYYYFKMARALNDLAYYSRMRNRLEDAETAIVECLYLKEEKKATLPRSLAVSWGEYSQILTCQGHFIDAAKKSDRALQIIDRTIEAGDNSAAADKGMLLVERATIFLMQGRLADTKQLLQQALLLLNDERDHYKSEAHERLTQIIATEEHSARYFLDETWRKAYQPLAHYDALIWHTQTGPFTDEEQQVWASLYPHRDDPTIWDQLATLMSQAKQREIHQSIIENRFPRIMYPAIDIDAVRTRIAGFEKLKSEIDRQETNEIVRRLYLKKIEEHLQELYLVQATYHGDMKNIQRFNEMLYGTVTKEEMTIALQELFKMLKRAQRHPLGKSIADDLLQEMRQWGLFAEDFVALEDEDNKARRENLQKWKMTTVSYQAVQVVFEEALKQYGFTDWQVVPTPERDGLSINPDLHILYLSTHARYSALSTAEYLTEEIETHIFRSAAGIRSKLALLGSGTRGYLPTEEGLAVDAIQKMFAAQGLGKKWNSWNHTLCAGLVTGILTSPHSIHSLYRFMSRAYLANHLQSGRFQTQQDAIQAAKQDALAFSLRSGRGITSFEKPGVCNLKDRVYLQGSLEVTKTLATTDPDRLYAGSIGVSDLRDLEELQILAPSIRRLALSHDPDLLQKIISYDKGIQKDKHTY